MMPEHPHILKIAHNIQWIVSYEKGFYSLYSLYSSVCTDCTDTTSADFQFSGMMCKTPKPFVDKHFRRL